LSSSVEEARRDKRQGGSERDFREKGRSQTKIATKVGGSTMGKTKTIFK
jgi:hypothetical protein